MLLVSFAARADEEDPFELRVIPAPGRTAFAEIADLDGDGRGDLVSASFTKLPPAQARTLRVHFQRADGALPDEPDWTAPLPEGAATFDIVRGRKADQMLFLQRQRVTILSLAGRVAAWRDVELPGTTLGVAADERGLDRLSLAREGLGPEPLLVVPGLGEIFVATLSGVVRGRLAAPARANYFVPPRPGALLSDSEAELYFEHPRIDVADVDGDGRGDLVVSNRHEVLVFEQDAEGRFSAQPQQRHVLSRLSETDHVRASGAARVFARDWNGDGRADLLVASTRGGILRAHGKATLHVNRGGTWNLQKSDQTFDEPAAWSAFDFEDLDADGRPEIVEARLPLGILDFVKVLLTRSVDAELRIYRAGTDTPFQAEPAFKRVLEVDISFETQRSVGFLPAFEDLNGDGRPDLILPPSAEQLEVYLGAPGPSLGARPVRQSADTRGVIRFGDLDRDRLLDFVLHDPRRPGTAIRVAVNRGVLPGTRTTPQLAEPAQR
jgi:hypothetical protein